jgi:hypothetical protein
MDRVVTVRVWCVTGTPSFVRALTLKRTKQKLLTSTGHRLGQEPLPQGIQLNAEVCRMSPNTPPIDFLKVV